MQPFRHLPDWRIDNLMISFSVPGGGVGPHPDLLQVEPFEAIIDEQMWPGDMLYIPPAFPHEGYALENELNYSVGFRAPRSRELVSGFADYVLAQELGGQRYCNPTIEPRDDPAHILPPEVDALRDMMMALMQQPNCSGTLNLAT